MAQLPVLPAPTAEIDSAERAFILMRCDTCNLNDFMSALSTLNRAYDHYFKIEYAQNGKKEKPDMGEKVIQNIRCQIVELSTELEYNLEKDSLKLLKLNFINTLTNTELSTYRKAWEDLHIEKTDFGSAFFLDFDAETGIPFNIHDYLNIYSMFHRLGDTMSNDYIDSQFKLINRLQKFELDDPIQSIITLNKLLPKFQVQHRLGIERLREFANIDDTLKQSAFAKKYIELSKITNFISILQLLGNAHSKIGDIPMAQKFYQETINTIKNMLLVIPKDRGRKESTIVVIRAWAIMCKHRTMYGLINTYKKTAQFDAGIQFIDDMLQHDSLFLHSIEWRREQIKFALMKGDASSVKKLKDIRLQESDEIQRHNTTQTNIKSNLIKATQKSDKLRYIETEWTLIEELIERDDIVTAKTHLDEMTLIIGSEPIYKPYYLKLIGFYEHMYRSNNQYIQALQYQLRYLNLKKQQLSEYSLPMVDECSKTAFLYLQNNQLDSAEVWYHQALNICKKLSFQWGIMDISVNLSFIAISKKDYTLAEKLLQPAKLFFQGRDFDYLSMGQAHLHLNMARIMIVKGQFSEAQMYAHKAFLYKKASALSPINQQFWSIVIAKNQNQMDTMMYFIENWMHLRRTTIQNRFTVLDDNAKTQFMEGLDSDFSLVTSILSDHSQHNDSVTSLFYNLALLQKSIVLSSVNNLQKIASQTTDTAIRQKVDLLLHFRRMLNKQDDYMNMSELNRRASFQKTVDSIQQCLNRTPFFQKEWANTTWQDVQKQLKENEVAIEIIDFKYDPSNLPFISTGAIVYYAAVVRKSDAQPTMIRLFEEKQLMAYLQRSPDMEDDAHVESLYVSNSAALYELIWQPFENAGLLKEGNTVYLSPSGQLNRIALAALMSPNAINKRFQDLYRLEMVNSTREIHVDAKDKTLRNNDLSALLVGGVQYEADSTTLVQRFKTQQALLKNQKEWVVRSLTPDADGRICKLDFLEGSLTEIQNIHSYLKTQKKVEADTLTGFSASEDIVRAKLKAAPTIVHLSTHGMYRLPENRKLTPMQALHNNFVLLSGCKRATCQGKPDIEGMHDGVLTAAEIADMDLKKTQLVVLSACETGLGDLRGREGVFGLARGFKLAGAKYQLVSLWKVPDAETSEFMQLFYQKALDGTTIQNAFLETQTELSQKYPDKPYNWAAWVLIR